MADGCTKTVVVAWAKEQLTVDFRVRVLTRRENHQQRQKRTGRPRIMECHGRTRVRRLFSRPLSVEKRMQRITLKYQQCRVTWASGEQVER